MATIKAVVRIENDGSALLVFHGPLSSGRAICYSRREGHNLCTPGYYRNSTTRSRDADDYAQAERLASHYRALCERIGDTLEIVARMDWTRR